MLLDVSITSDKAINPKSIDWSTHITTDQGIDNHTSTYL